jgi:hypothetical protein
MKKRISLLMLLPFIASTIHAGGESNLSQEELTKKHIEEQLAREKKYAKEKAFYHGKEFNLSEFQVDEKSLDSIPSIEPEDDFDITDVYRDDQ